MSQTILDEYLASLDEEDDSNLPDPRPYGFNSVAAMLTEAQDAMMALGETIGEQKRVIATQAAEIERLTRLPATAWRPVEVGERIIGEYVKLQLVMGGAILNVDVLDDNEETVCYSIVLPNNMRLCCQVKP